MVELTVVLLGLALVYFWIIGRQEARILLFLLISGGWLFVISAWIISGPHPDKALALAAIGTVTIWAICSFPVWINRLRADFAAKSGRSEAFADHAGFVSLPPSRR